MSRLWYLLAAALIWLAGLQTLAAAPAADLWPRWQAHDGDSTKTVDHSAFDRFLKRYVVESDHGPNGVRYAAVSHADAQALDDYIDRLEQVEIADYARPEQRAYWINLYNAITLALVVDHWPVDSIRDIDAGLLDSGPWDEERATVEGVRLSLNDIEHRILRPIWHDTLTHYGVNCVSISCPALLPRAYTGQTVETRLADNARAYIASLQGVTFKDDRLIVSRIYQWYAADFGDPAGVLSHLAEYGPADLAKRLGSRQQIDGYAYDWSVNSAANVAALPAEP